MSTLGLSAAAFQAAQRDPRKSFSTAYVRDQAKEDKVAALFRVGCDDDYRTHQRNNVELAKQFAVILDGKIQAITRPTFATTGEGNMPIVLASLSDTIDTIVPVKLSKSHFVGHFTSLIRSEDAANFGLPVATEEPQHLNAPVPEDGPEPPQPSFARVHFVVHNAGDAPVAVALPLVLPIPIGTPFPVGHSLDEPLTEEIAPWPFFRVWAAAHHYVRQHNNGISVTFGGLLFERDAFHMAPFAGLPMPVRVDGPDVVLLFPDSPHYKNVIDIMRQEQRSTWIHIADTSDIPPPPGLVSQGSLGADEVKALLMGAFEASAQQLSPTKHSLNDQELITHADDICTRYSIAFGSVQPADPDDPTKGHQVVPAPISDAFKSIIGSSKTTVAMRQFHDLMGVAIRNASNHENRIQAGATLSVSQLDAPMLTRLKNFQFATEPLAIQPNRVKSELSPFSFLTARTNSVVFQERLHAGAKIQAQVMMEEDKSRVARRQTDLYYQGQQDTLHAVLAPISNFYILGQVISPAFAKSELWRALKTYYNQCSSHKARAWSDAHATVQTVFHNMVLDLANVMGSYMTLGNHLEYRTAVTSDRPISPKAYQDATSQCESVVHQLNQLMTHMQPGRYTDAPATHEFFFPIGKNEIPSGKGSDAPPSKPKGKSTDGNDSNKNKGKEGKDNKQRKPKDTHNSDNDPAKQVGFLIYTGPHNKRFPFPKILLQKKHDDPSQGMTNICMSYLLQGRACKFGKECNNKHLDAFTDIPADQQTDFVQYVQGTDDLDFVQGKGPSPGTP